MNNFNELPKHKFSGEVTLFIVSSILSVIIAIPLGFVLTVIFGILCKECGLGAIFIPFVAFPFSLMTAFPFSFWLMRRKIFKADEVNIKLRPIQELFFYYISLFIAIEVGILVFLIGFLYYLGVNPNLLTLVEFTLFPILIVSIFYYLTRRLLFKLGDGTFVKLAILSIPGAFIYLLPLMSLLNIIFPWFDFATLIISEL